MGGTDLTDKFPACVRYGSMTPDETHICYFCGFPIDVKLPYHSCGSMVQCPKCGKCGCNVSITELSALITLRNKFCCNAFNFVEGTFSDADEELLKIVPRYKDTLSHCRELEWELASETNQN